MGDFDKELKNKYKAKKEDDATLGSRTKPKARKPKPYKVMTTINSFGLVRPYCFGRYATFKDAKKAQKNLLKRDGFYTSATIEGPDG